MLEKPGAQNITACKNQGKQCELSGHRKLKKQTFFFKQITRDHAKKTIRLTEIHVSYKSDKKTFIKRVFKKTKVTQLFKPIYWEITTNARSN